MFKYYIKKITQNDVVLIKPFKRNNLLQNPAIFWYEKITDLKSYKYVFIWNLYKLRLNLDKIYKRIKKDKEQIDDIQYKILIKEIKFIYKKIEFLKNVYDFEANKIDKNYKILNKDFDYDYYNKIFYWVTKEDIISDIEISNIKEENKTITKLQLIELLKFTKQLVPWFKYKFWPYVILSHNSWELNIPSKKIYSLREVITLFFHEMTHFFRRYNSIRNYWIWRWFLDYMKLEEWFALYNEYYYWKKLIKWFEYNAYYVACFDILRNKKYSEKEKKEKIYEILREKWNDREKSLFYYYRFYRYSSFWSNKFFLKDLIYSKWYISVKKLIQSDSMYYDILFSWKIWTSFIQSNIYDTSNNFDTKKYFNSILREIKKAVWFKKNSIY